MSHGTANRIAGFTLKIALLAALLSFTLFQIDRLHASSSDNRNLGNEVIYQVVLDRFYDGNPRNNAFPDDPQGLYDPTKTQHPMARFGGDITGLIEKLPYLKELGVTMIWISPVIENAKELVPEEKGDLKGEMNSNYHGYWGTDWFRVDRHLQDSGEKGFDAVARLVDAAAADGIKIIVDTVINHSNNWDISKGRLYRDGAFLTDRDKEDQAPEGRKWYHVEDDIPLNTDVNLFSYFKVLSDKMGITSVVNSTVLNGRLAGLADFDIDGNPEVMDYMVDAHLDLLKTGVAGFRVDTIPYVPLASVIDFEKRIRAQYPKIPMIGEWFAGGPTRIKSMDFYSKSDFSMFDFDLRWVFEKGFVGDDNYGYRTFNWLIDKVSDSFEAMKSRGLDPNDMVNFVDNHDIPRLRATKKALEAAYAMLFAMPGVPCIYYGDEQDLRDGSGRRGMGDQIGGDPFNRSMMKFKNDPSMMKKFKDLIELRKEYPVFRYGSFSNLDGQLKRYSNGRARAVSDKFGFISSCGRDRSYGLVREDKDYLAFYFTNVTDDYCHIEMKEEFKATLLDTVSNEDIYRIPQTNDGVLSMDMAPFDYLIMVYKKSDSKSIFSSK